MKAKLSVNLLKKSFCKSAEKEVYINLGIRIIQNICGILRNVVNLLDVYIMHTYMCKVNNHRNKYSM